MSILFKCCSCFSIILCSNFVGYHLIHIELSDITLGNFSPKLPFGENSDDEDSFRRKFRSAKFRLGENSFGENFFSEKSFGENSSPDISWVGLGSCIQRYLMVVRTLGSVWLFL